ncbi:DsbE family thiol:disulfide interchange protein [Maritalea porphyrae]|jgi:cytochrome c biogenesis protein CcmG/thiol:disulfide interchange protein DsbE|uniref:DsbE family thiol:disulfide interchange protein n=1 Tax=Maritalea porphyrae TaxID=880732 RepID=UPI0022AF20E3|nr:DsbE family thiol:disulfide interchange protein [Maritalea porphyrae]MCZ4272310.1 DsbE family thiol:disulfide interchange protein [Maritalea porphyrae]
MKRIWIYLLPLIITGGLFALFASQINKDPNLLPSALLNKPAPQFELAGIEGHNQSGFSTQDLMGQITLVNVFASWCVPCRDEHEFLIALAKRSDVKIYGINYNDQPENARQFLAELGNPYAAIGADRNRRVSLDWGVYGVPESYLVNQDGMIVYKHTGPINAQSFEQDVVPAIEKALDTLSTS